MNRGSHVILCHVSTIDPFVIPKKKLRPSRNIQSWFGGVRSRDRTRFKSPISISTSPIFHGADKLRRMNIIRQARVGWCHVSYSIDGGWAVAQAKLLRVTPACSAAAEPCQANTQG
jgi:hypothetical protein